VDGVGVDGFCPPVDRPVDGASRSEAALIKATLTKNPLSEGVMTPGTGHDAPRTRPVTGGPAGPSLPTPLPNPRHEEGAP